MEPAAFFILVI